MPQGKVASSILGQRLRDIRRSKGVKSTQTLEGLMGGKYSFSTISRRETGDLKIDFEYLEDFCRALNLAEDEKQELMTSARLKLSKIHDQKETLALEYASITSNLKLYQAYMPGYIDSYLQTYNYSKSIIENYGFFPNPEEIAKNRHATYVHALEDRTKAFRIICLENALYYHVGGAAVMLEQLQKLLTFKDEPHLEFRILPKEASFPIPLHEAFNIIDGNYCFCENRLDFSITDAPDIVSRFQADFDTLWSHSVIGVRRNQIIERAIGHYRSLGGNGKHNPQKGYSQPPQTPAHA